MGVGLTSRGCLYTVLNAVNASSGIVRPAPIIDTPCFSSHTGKQFILSLLLLSLYNTSKCSTERAVLSV